MMTVSPKHRVFLAIEPIDFRKGLDGISRLCHDHFHLNPMTGHYFIFRNKTKTAIKLLYYDSQGYCLLHKRLSAGRFAFWPTDNAVLISLTPLQLQILLHNGDPSKTQEGLVWHSVM